MIDRSRFIGRIHNAIRRSPITALVGPRQCGKTTLARVIAKESESVYFDLESPTDLARLANPTLTLQSCTGLIIIDEIQHRPDLFGLLRVLADRTPVKAHFLILGSASPSLIKNTSETLAGRIEFVDLSGFDMWEVGVGALEKLWIRGGYPKSFLAGSGDDSRAWRDSFIRTFLERDIPLLGFKISSVTLRRFWTMLAHSHGQVLNSSEIARSLGITDKTVRNYLDILEGTYMVRQLNPWHEDLGKRQVKSPKIYIRDSGLFHSLLSLHNKHSLLGHPKLGASWEGFMLEHLLQVLSPTEAYFWGTHNGVELDLLVLVNGKKIGFEFRWSDAPRITRSMGIALTDLKLTRLWVVYPGTTAYDLDANIRVVPARDVSGVVNGLTAS